jgi:lytic cellulose monooxygenase (C1-hydroxylating)
MTSTSGTPAQYGDDVMIANNNTWTVKIPSDITPGNYVLRHETIALHQAQTVGGAQNYPQCINLQISGSGTANPDGVLGTQLYKPSDAGIVFNLYTTYSDTAAYTVPGPTLYSGATNIAQGSGGATAATSAAQATSKATSSAASSAPATTAGNTRTATTQAAQATTASSASGANFAQISAECAKAMAGQKREHARDFVA